MILYFLHAFRRVKQRKSHRSWTPQLPTKSPGTEQTSRTPKLWKISFCSNSEDPERKARSRVLRFGVKSTFLGGKIFSLMYFLKQIFLGTTKFEGAKKIGGHCPRMLLPWLRSCRASRDPIGTTLLNKVNLTDQHHVVDEVTYTRFKYF